MCVCVCVRVYMRVWILAVTPKTMKKLCWYDDYKTHSHLNSSLVCVRGHLQKQTDVKIVTLIGGVVCVFFFKWPQKG